MDKREKAFLLNFFLPGTGYFYLGEKMTGCLILLIALFFFFAACWELLEPIVLTFRELLENPQQGKVFRIEVMRVLLNLGGLCLVWLISSADLLIRKREEKKRPHP